MSEVNLEAGLAYRLQQIAQEQLLATEDIEKLVSPDVLKSIVPVLLGRAEVGPVREFAIYGTIDEGREKLPYEFVYEHLGIKYEKAREALLDDSYFVSDEPGRQWDLVLLSGYELGFKQHLPRRYFETRGELLGLSKVPPSIIPHIPIACRDPIPKSFHLAGEAARWCHIASVPWRPHGLYAYFTIGVGSELGLESDCPKAPGSDIDFENRYPPYHKWIFAKKRKEK
ncbi:MAG: hypothetical protein RLZZ480_133 [Candidatus Parcubacteria bacterium]|jgi:hypothetical protein